MCATWPRVHVANRSWARGARRYLAGGTFLRFAELVARLGVVTGRRLRAVTVPAGLLLPAGRAVQLVQRIVPVQIPVGFEGIYLNWCAARSDDIRTNRVGRGPARYPGDPGRLGPVAGRAGPHLPQASRPARQRLMCPATKGPGG